MQNLIQTIHLISRSLQLLHHQFSINFEIRLPTINHLQIIKAFPSEIIACSPRQNLLKGKAHRPAIVLDGLSFPVLWQNVVWLLIGHFFLQGNLELKKKKNSQVKKINNVLSELWHAHTNSKRNFTNQTRNVKKFEKSRLTNKLVCTWSQIVRRKCIENKKFVNYF
jgi:hypothetical protein